MGIAAAAAAATLYRIKAGDMSPCVVLAEMFETLWIRADEQKVCLYDCSIKFSRTLFSGQHNIQRFL
jgi:streptomycin 6-kinase